jgi:hypothetical protein
MEVREWVEVLKGDCARGSEFRALGSDVWTRDLLKEEAAILAATADGEAVHLDLLGDAEFPAIYAGDVPVFEESGSYARSQQWYALESLALRGLLQHNGNGHFALDEAARLRGARLRTMRLSGDR